MAGLNCLTNSQYVCVCVCVLSLFYAARTAQISLLHVCYLAVIKPNIRMRSHHLLRLDDNKAAASYQQD